MNFGLRVLGRRPDGYHEIESLFLPLDLEDEVGIEIEAAPETAVELRVEGGGDALPRDARNLAARAARAFLAEARLARRVRLRLVKRIPEAAGLGGGSSDAGAVLRGLAELLPRAVTPAALRALALRLGADVPFFLDPRPARVGGIGERCEAIEPPWPAFSLVLANPGVALSTAEVFAAHAAAPPARRAPPPPPLAGLRAAPADPALLAALLANDLEETATRLCPAIAPLADALRAAGAAAVGLSGSGATVFGVFATPERAAAVLPAASRGAAWSRLATTRESR